MDTMTDHLPPRLRRRLRHTAIRRKLSEAEVLEAILDRELDPEPRPRPRLPLFSSGDPTLAERVDEALEGFGE